MQYQAVYCNEVALTEALHAASQSEVHTIAPKQTLSALCIACAATVILYACCCAHQMCCSAAEDGLLLLQLDLVADMPMNSSNKYFGSQWRR